VIAGEPVSSGLTVAGPELARADFRHSPDGAAEKRPERRARPGVFVVAFSAILVMALALGEILARLTFHPVSPPPAGAADVHPLNPAGFHDVEHEVAKPAGTYRLMCLGDSFTFARGIPFNDTFCRRAGAQLEQHLGAKGQAEHVEEINIAREGLSTVREVQMLERHHALDLAPDVLVLGFVLNDPEDESRPAELKELHEPVLRREPAGWLAPLTHASRLADLTFERVENTRRYHALVHYYRELFHDDYPGWPMCQASFQHLAELTRASGTHVLVVIFPLLDFQLDSHYPFRRLHERAAALAHANGFEVLDLLPVYAPHEGPGLVRFPGFDPHPSVEAHHLAARAISTEIERLGWMKAAPLLSKFPSGA